MAIPKLLHSVWGCRWQVRGLKGRFNASMQLHCLTIEATSCWSAFPYAASTDKIIISRTRKLI